jgi:hypothetical protein
MGSDAQVTHPPSIPADYEHAAYFAAHLCLSAFGWLHVLCYEHGWLAGYP